MLIEKCPLCLEVKPIVRSHLIPKAMYEYCSPPGGNPIFIRSEVAMETSRQVQHPLLCEACELTLNKGGETWLLPLMARHEGDFPFYDLVAKLPVVGQDGDSIGYSAANSAEIKADKLVHFGMGVFWKAAVHSWRGGQTEPMIELGPYLEGVRTFLRGETSFPERMIFNVGVLRPPVKNISFSFPYRGQAAEWHNYLFYVLGIEFALGVGNKVSDDIRRSCFASNPIHMVIVCDFAKDIQANLVGIWQKARKAKNIDKYLRKR